MLWASMLTPGLRGRLRNSIDTVRFVVIGGTRLVLGFDAEKWIVAAIVLTAAGCFVYLFLRERQTRPVLASLLTANAAVSIAYGLTLTERQIWWLVLPFLTLFLAVFITIPQFTKRLHHRFAEIGVQIFILLLTLTLFASWQKRNPVLYPWQPDVLDSQRYFARLVPPGRRIGCFNSGISLFYGDAEIVALDGIVSHQARLAWQRRTLGVYIRDQDVAFIADEQRTLNLALQFSGLRAELIRVADRPLRGWPTGVRVLWRVRDGP